MRVYHFLKKDYGLEALEKQRLKVATINDLNDPFELLAADISQSDERHKFIEWKNQISEKRGMLCFSKTWRNLLLWSHYADKHCGVALELEIKDDFIFPVQYSKKRLSLDIPVIMRAGGFTETLAEKLVSTKSAHWKYEK